MDIKAIELVNEIVEIYGVNSFHNNLTEDNTVEEEGIWFECPECGEPILIGDDWTLDEVKDRCPICGFNFWTQEDESEMI